MSLSPFPLESSNHIWFQSIVFRTKDGVRNSRSLHEAHFHTYFYLGFCKNGICLCLQNNTETSNPSFPCHWVHKRQQTLSSFKILFILLIDFSVEQYDSAPDT